MESRGETTKAEPSDDEPNDLSRTSIIDRGGKNEKGGKKKKYTHLKRLQRDVRGFEDNLLYTTGPAVPFCVKNG